uniref:Uncharacterized protein n=1 Tax=Ananas comosus var. bracteatus TaxID=296719 RepID=A0A6V7PBP6_ANACO|nr:unnamed protein product [Ananas comosus var. bracteatus]
MESDNQSNSVAEDDERGNGQCIVCESKEDSNSGKIPHIIVQRNDGEVRFCKHSEMIGESDLAALECEISDLSERLEALEADHNFLEHSINSLRNGEEGVQFIQEIASHLQELREIGSQGNSKLQFNLYSCNRFHGGSRSNIHNNSREKHWIWSFGVRLCEYVLR